MIALKGIKMPQNCSECQFKANDYVCGLLDCAFSCNHFKERNYNCPLVEIVTCKDCKYCDFDDSDQTFFCNTYGNIVCSSHFCSDAERRE